MRILYVTHQFFPEYRGRTEKVCLNLARAAQRSGHYVHVLACAMELDSVTGAQSTTQPPGCVRTTYQGVPVTLIPRSKAISADLSLDPDLQVASELAKWMDSERFGIAHVMHPMWTASAVLAVRRSGIPYLVTLTDFLVPPWSKSDLTESYGQAEAILAGAAARTCPSEFVAAQYRTDFPSLSFSVIPHGIDVLALQTDESHVECGGSEVRLGYVGALAPQYGVDTLLNAFVRVPNPNLRLRICCEHGAEDTFARDVRRLAGSDWRIELVELASLDSVFRLIQSLDVLCMPSRVPETFSFVLHEAALAGVPTLVSALGEPGDVVAAYGSGMALPREDAEAWVEAISKLSEQPSVIKAWAALVPMPLRVEEEAFFYESLYRPLHLGDTASARKN